MLINICSTKPTKRLAGKNFSEKAFVSGGM